MRQQAPHNTNPFYKCDAVMPDTISINGERFVTVSALARHASIHPSTISLWIKSGRIAAILHPALKKKKYLIPESEVKRLLGI